MVHNPTYKPPKPLTKPDIKAYDKLKDVSLFDEWYKDAITLARAHGVDAIFDPNFRPDMNNYDKVMLFKAKQTFFYAVLCYTIKPMELHQYVERHCAQSNVQAALQDIVDHAAETKPTSRKTDRPARHSLEWRAKHDRAVSLEPMPGSSRFNEVNQERFDNAHSFLSLNSNNTCCCSLKTAFSSLFLLSFLLGPTQSVSFTAPTGTTGLSHRIGPRWKLPWRFHRHLASHRTCPLLPSLPFSLSLFSLSPLLLLALYNTPPSRFLIVIAHDALTISILKHYIPTIPHHHFHPPSPVARTVHFYRPQRNTHYPCPIHQQPTRIPYCTNLRLST
jgi:hypothetical protein